MVLKQKTHLSPQNVIRIVPTWAGSTWAYCTLCLDVTGLTDTLPKLIYTVSRLTDTIPWLTDTVPELADTVPDCTSVYQNYTWLYQGSLTIYLGLLTWYLKSLSWPYVRWSWSEQLGVNIHNYSMCYWKRLTHKWATHIHKWGFIYFTYKAELMHKDTKHKKEYFAKFQSRLGPIPIKVLIYEPDGSEKKVIQKIWYN